MIDASKLRNVRVSGTVKNTQLGRVWRKAAVFCERESLVFFAKLHLVFRMLFITLRALYWFLLTANKNKLKGIFFHIVIIKAERGLQFF